ncbi:hypothetical protein RND71_020249 [Anisodus tanguticus]|uniref:Uncharacterized protein n=1 Tax=Anisodus tanguticus TaxID=243964 RepID=A0AAE1VA66_9SOLA|nr:hypothetical protein RND71_020249 [Anisodus tanguticus]
MKEILVHEAQASFSSSDEVSSQPVVPSASSHGISSQPAKHRVREKVDPDWLVDVIDTHQVVKTVRLKVKGVHNLDNGLRIIVEFDEYASAIEKSDPKSPFLHFIRNNNDSSDDEFDFSFGLSDSVTNSSFGDSSDTLKSLISCASDTKRNLLANTSKIVEKNKSCKRKDDLTKIVTDELLALGYKASICKWEKALCNTSNLRIKA